MASFVRLSTTAAALHIRPAIKVTGICRPKNQMIFFQIAGISSLKKLGPDYKRKDPWPYEQKKYTYLHGYIDSTLDRFDENTKMVVVDGNIAAGKNQFAKELAEQLGMHYMPEPTFDDFYINAYGYDYRLCDPYIPASCQSCDIKKFMYNPHHLNVFMMQKNKFMMRLENYIDGLAHLLNTGQGVVMTRSHYSDFVFVDAMAKFGYISKNAQNYYYKCRKNVAPFIFRPHLAIYLDVPVDVCMERIKKRNIDYEVKTSILTKEYLQAIEDGYKRKYLPEVSVHAETLIYDWSNYGDVELIVDDIEHIEMEHPDRKDPKMKDWKFHEKWDYNYYRRFFTNQKQRAIQYVKVIPVFDVPEYMLPWEDFLKYKDFMEKHVPGYKYEPGFNEDQGDSFLFKAAIPFRKRIVQPEF